MKILIGNTGLVGQTMIRKRNFDYTFNSKNINQYDNFIEDNCELFLTCLPATKWLVNKDLKKDMDNINNIIEIIRPYHYSKVTLISTIDVYNDSPFCVDEDYNPNISKLSYGNNRYIFELLVREYVKTDDLKIFRLPALFNKDIKKNILYDLLNNNNVEEININSYYQWYNLDDLPMDIDRYNELFSSKDLFNLFTSPLHTGAIIDLFPKYENNIFRKNVLQLYDYKTKYDVNKTGYMLNHDYVLAQIKILIHEYSNK